MEIERWTCKAKGYIADTKACLEWDFELKDLHDKNTILFYHGSDDMNAPVSGARYLHERIPNSELKEVFSSSHKSIQSLRMEMLERMLGYS